MCLETPSSSTPAASVAAPAAPRGVGGGRFGGGYTSRGGGEGHRLGRTCSLVFLITVSKNEKKKRKQTLPGRSRHTRLESPIVVDPQLPPLLHLLHLEVLVVAGLVVVTRV